MKNPYSAKSRIVVEAPVQRVWQALTDPAQVKEYLFGTDMTAQWKVGGAITYRGTWEGKPYEDKGVIKELIPGRRLVSTYWSPFSGLPDSPENYNTVTYELEEDGGRTTLTVLQDNIATQESADHSGANWKVVLEKLKELVER